MTGARIAAAPLLAGLLVAGPATAQVERVEMDLTEPVRPLAALAAERALRGLPGVGDVRTDLGRGCLVVLPAPDGPGLDPRPMLQHLAGAAPRELRVTAVGSLVTGAVPARLALGGALPLVLLAGPGWPADPAAVAGLSGQVLRVSGALARLTGPGPPELQVAAWEPVLPEPVPPADPAP